MTTTLVKVRDLIQTYSNSAHPIDPLEVMRRFLYEQGFDEFMAREIQNPYSQDIPITIYDGPVELALRWSQNRGELHDIGVRRTLAAQRASTWAELRPLAKGPARKIFDDLDDFGMRNGLSVPFHILDRNPMLVSIAGDVATDMTPDDVNAVQLLTNHFLSLWLADQPMKERDYAALSPQEVEVLAAHAAGVIGKELQKKLGITANTERTHQRNIRQKLGARTIAQAVQIGTKNGLIP